jgi:uncharacterized protein YkwD
MTSLRRSSTYTAPAARRRHAPLVALVVAVVAGLTAAALAGSSSAGAVSGSGRAPSVAAQLPAPDQAAQEFVARINGLRASQGLGELRIDPELTREAQIWASTMTDAGRIFHSDDLSRGIGADWQKLGENVGVGGQVDVLFQAFVDSPTHYANLVDPTYTHVGVGVVNSPDGVRLFTAHRFMSLRPAAPPPPPAAPAPPAQEAPPATAAPTTVAPTTTAAPATTTTVAPAPPPKLGPVERVAELLA